MKNFSIKLIGIYLIFMIGAISLGGTDSSFKKESDEVVEVEKVKELKKTSLDINLTNAPTYTVIIPETPEQVLIEREGNYVYSGELLSLDSLDVIKKKKVFINLLIPAIDAFERELDWKKKKVQELTKLETLSNEQNEFLEELFNDYKIKDRNIDRLSSHMIMPPKSLIISQGALESGWGTSRFFKEANNIFGVWSYNSNEPRIAAQTRSNGFTPYLKKYDSLKGSVEDYILLLSRSSHYSDLRGGIRRGESSIELAGYLVNYSELGEEYVRRVTSTVNSNNLTELDQR